MSPITVKRTLSPMQTSRQCSEELISYAIRDQLSASANVSDNVRIFRLANIARLGDTL